MVDYQQLTSARGTVVIVDGDRAINPTRRDVLKLGIAAVGVMPVRPWASSFAQEGSPSEYPAFAHVQSTIRRTITLDGNWQFQLDPYDRGVGEQWFLPNRTFEGEIVVPGAWQTQGFGKSYETPQSQRQIGTEVGPQTQFLGTGWYKRHVTVPRVWARQRVWLKFGAVNPAAECWVNARWIGGVTQPGIPTRFDVTDQIKPGQTNDITVRVYERNRGLGCWYNLMACWSGLWRTVTLEVTREAWIHDLRVLPDLDRSVAMIRAEIRGAIPSRAILYTDIAGAGGVSRPVSGEGYISVESRIANPRPWSPADPHLYSVRVSLMSGDEHVDDAAVRFGLRKFEGRGDRLYLNNKPVLFRSYGDDGMYPITLHPETRSAILRKQLSAAKNLGFNAAYPCAFTPPDEFLDAADELGFLVQVDVPAVIDFQRHGPGGLPSDPAEESQLVREQWLATLRWTQNHPSVVIYAPGSEIFPDDPHVQGLYDLARQLDPTRLVMSWSGLLGATDVADVGTLYEPMDPSEQLHLQMASAPWRDSRGIPGIAHEFAAAECLPDPKQIPLYDHGLNPLLETEVLHAAQARGIEHLLPALIENSRKLQAVCRRVQIEECRKVPSLSGYKVWLVSDIPGYPQGVFDSFGEVKVVGAGGLVRSNADTVLLMNERSNRTRRTFRSGESVDFEVFISHYGSLSVDNATLRWSIAAGEQILASGSTPVSKVAPFTVSKLTELRVTMPSVSRPQAAQLSFSSHNASPSAENAWAIWLFPEPQFPSGNIAVYSRNEGWSAGSYFPVAYNNWDGKAVDLLITGQLDRLVRGYLAEGGKVLLLLEGSDSLLRSKAIVHTQFMPRWPLTNGRDISCTLISKHPALGDFPNDGFCDFQFYNLIVYPFGSLLTHPLTAKRPEYSRGLGVAINIDKLSTRIEPIIRVFGINENRAYLCEATVGKGRMLATTMRISQATQFPEGAWLMAQLIAYSLSDEFKPAATLTLEDLVRWKEGQA